MCKLFEVYESYTWFHMKVFFLLGTRPGKYRTNKSNAHLHNIYKIRNLEMANPDTFAVNKQTTKLWATVHMTCIYA